MNQGMPPHRHAPTQACPHARTMSPAPVTLAWLCSTLLDLIPAPAPPPCAQGDAVIAVGAAARAGGGAEEELEEEEGEPMMAHKGGL